MSKDLTIPGDLLSGDVRLAGEGTYIEDEKVYASVCGVVDRGEKIRVVPLTGKYMPCSGDVVVGKIIDVRFSSWTVDINSPYEARLHISEYPKRINPGETNQHLGIGELIIAKVTGVDAAMRVDLTMRDGGKAIRSGRLIEISHTKIPRAIGRGGSMINLIKNETNCDIFVSQNGRIWINGREDMVTLAADALLKIEQEAHTFGLTDTIREFIENAKRDRK
ncbi:MAG: RNA-binding protein [Methanosarcinales archaeon]|nr:MAG: RNA-binding protein [Methanosarcinales archaeon]